MTTIRKGDRFITDAPRSTSKLCRYSNGDPIDGIVVANEVTSIRSGTVYYRPIYSCCRGMHRTGITGTERPPLHAPLIDLQAGRITSPFHPPIKVTWIPRDALVGTCDRCDTPTVNLGYEIGHDDRLICDNC